jgi:hypothetical protein
MLKSFVGEGLKRLDDKGRGVAVISTLNVIDKDGDVTRPGAFGNDQVAPIVPAHNWEHVPIGKGQIFESGNEVLFDFQMNMKVGLARAWYEAMKFDMENPPAKQEWSYGYSAKRKPGEHEGEDAYFLDAIKVHEVSPVLLGAGVNTRTLAMKQDIGECVRKFVAAGHSQEEAVAICLADPNAHLTAARRSADPEEEKIAALTSKAVRDYWASIDASARRVR